MKALNILFKKEGLHMFSTYKNPDILKSFKKPFSIFLRVTRASFETANGAIRWNCHPDRGISKMSSQLPFIQSFLRKFYLLIFYLFFKVCCAVIYFNSKESYNSDYSATLTISSCKFCVQRKLATSTTTLVEKQG